MQRYTIFFIIVNAVQISGDFSAHHQELKNCTHSIGYMSSLLAATASASSKQAWHISDAVCKTFELLMMGGETAWNMYSIDNNKEYCITLHGPMNVKIDLHSSPWSDSSIDGLAIYCTFHMSGNIFPLDSRNIHPLPLIKLI